MAKSLDEMSNEERSEALQDLDETIQSEQTLIASTRRKLNLHYRMREDILNYLAIGAIRKGWKH